MKEIIKEIKVSIILLRRPGEDLSRVLKGIEKLDYPKKSIEIIISDGLNIPKQINRAVKAALGEIILFIDTDAFPSKDSLQLLLKHFNNPEVAVVGGPKLNPVSDSFLQKCFGTAMQNPFGSSYMAARYKKLGKARLADERSLSLCNLAVRRKVLKKHPFREELFPNEEVELCFRLRNKGYKLVYESRAVCFHSMKHSFLKFFVQIFRYGRGKGELLFIQPSVFRLIYIIPSLWVLYLVSLIFFHPTTYFIGVALYLFLALAASVFEAAKKKNPALTFMLPFVFFMLHIAYGLGLPVGMFKKIFLSTKPYPSKVVIKKIKGFKNGFKN